MEGLAGFFLSAPLGARNYLILMETPLRREFFLTEYLFPASSLPQYLTVTVSSSSLVATWYRGCVRLLPALIRYFTHALKHFFCSMEKTLPLVSVIPISLLTTYRRV